MGVLRTEVAFGKYSYVSMVETMFTRANDFGYSKNVEETIDIWDSDIVKHETLFGQ